MGVETCFLLVCDKCEKPYNSYDVCNNDSETDLIKEAILNGWDIDEETDKATCPHCKGKVPA